MALWKTHSYWCKYWFKSILLTNKLCHKRSARPYSTTYENNTRPRLARVCIYWLYECWCNIIGFCCDVKLLKRVGIGFHLLVRARHIDVEGSCKCLFGQMFISCVHFAITIWRCYLKDCNMYMLCPVPVMHVLYCIGRMMMLYAVKCSAWERLGNARCFVLFVNSQVASQPSLYHCYFY